MSFDKDNPAPVTAGNGVRNTQHLQVTKLPKTPQEPALWEAYVSCVERYKHCPSLMNKVIAEAVASACNTSFKSEVCHAE